MAVEANPKVNSRETKWIIKVCIPPEEGAIAPKAREIHYYLLFLRILSNAAENDTSREVRHLTRVITKHDLINILTIVDNFDNV